MCVCVCLCVFLCVCGAVKPLFSNKSKTASTIILHENHRIIKDNKKIFEQKFREFDKIHETNMISPSLKNKPLKHLLKYFKKQSIK